MSPFSPANRSHGRHQLQAGRSGLSGRSLSLMASMRASCSAQICLLHVPGPSSTSLWAVKRRASPPRAPRAPDLPASHFPGHPRRAPGGCNGDRRLLGARLEGCPDHLAPRLPGQPRRALGALARPHELPAGRHPLNAAGSGARARGDPMEAKWLRARRQYSTSAVICSSPWPARYFIRARQRSPLASSQAREDR